MSIQATRTEADSDRARALEVLTDPAHAEIVDVVVWRDGPDGYGAANAGGEVSFRRRNVGTGWVFDVEVVAGANPFADQSTDRFVGLAAEMAGKYPRQADNSYPYAYEQVAQLFDSPDAPDLCVIHSARHNWEDHGGERGEHGSLDLIQSRAPFIIGGAGIARAGVVDRHARLIDVAPTVLALLGAGATSAGVGLNGSSRPDAVLARQDGEPIADVRDPAAAAPQRVIGILWDGCNPNVLLDMVARGEAPNVARLIEMGQAFSGGALASLPTITLANHTSILTGAHPGHHGILNNAWWSRRLGRQVITNSPATWPQSMETLDASVETIHQAVHRNWPDALTWSVNEPCDVGADYSTFAVIRGGELPPFPPEAAELPHATEWFVRPVKSYRLSSRIDQTAVDQAVALIGGHYRDQEWPAPRFAWINFTLTDAAFHHGGPHSDIARASIADSDGRLGEIFAAAEAAGWWDTTAWVLVADHGMEDSDPTCTGDWDEALRAAGVQFRDEAYSFIYLGDFSGSDGAGHTAAPVSALEAAVGLDGDGREGV